MFKKIANDGRLLLAIYVGTLNVMALGFHAIEKTPWTLLECYYWASSTITTVGYGDIAPKTDAGKMFAIVCQQWGIVIVLALTIAWVLGKVNKDLYTHEEQVDDDMDRETIKAELVAIKEMLNAQRR